MLESCKTAQERWGGVHQIIDSWLAERRELISLYFALEGITPFEKNRDSEEDKLTKFCEVLVDYISSGHFEVYEQLLHEAKAFNDGSERLISHLMPKIQTTTETALDFNDLFSTAELVQANVAKVHDQLSVLGEALEERFELEDRLIQDIHEAHREVA
ncbi:sigma D regulator [Salinibius halmophilus]|uniref:sigma D regulator n=1 Tax=Salinibius halmophilus TaxID=1853216 RepID=UPI000E66D9CC|nr:sigma D regulator [Salinibius halmophilus]